MKIIADIPDNILSIINDNNGLISSEQLAILQKSIMDGALYFDTPKCIIKVNTAVEAQTIANELKRQEAVGVIIPNEFEIERLNKPQGVWTPVSERLPEDMQRVLIWFEYYRYGDFNCMYQTYGFGYVCDGKWSPFINGETGWQDYRVIAWQPLPEPYKEGGEAND